VSDREPNTTEDYGSIFLAAVPFRFLSRGGDQRPSC
jgi:hypothetical protein